MSAVCRNYMPVGKEFLAGQIRPSFSPFFSTTAVWSTGCNALRGPHLIEERTGCLDLWV